MASDFLTQYTEAADTDFRNRLVQCLAKVASQKLNATVETADEYPRYVKLARQAFGQDQEGVTFAARALVAQGITNSTLDPEMETAVDTYFDVIAKSFDPDIV